MADDSNKGSDPNDEILRKFGDPSKSEDHKVFDPKALPKEPDSIPFKITTSGTK